MAKQEWRLLDLKMSSYASASLYMPAILTLKEEGRVPNTFALITFEKPAASLFYYSDPDREIDLNFCREYGIEVGRRDSGGSPYWMDPGTLLFFLCFDKRDVPGFPQTISEAYKFLIEASAESISRRFDIPCVFRPLNDLEVQGRKIAGHILTFLGNTCRWSGGPQILKPRMDLMLRVLKPPPEKFADKEAKNVETRSTSLEALLGRPPSFDDVKQAYVLGLEQRLGVVFRPGELGREEKALMAEREKRDFSEEWIMAMSEKRKFGPLTAGARRGEQAVKVPQGPLIRAVVLLSEGKISNLSLTGSIHCVPVRIVEEMEAALRGVEATREAISKIVGSFFQRPGVQIASAEPEHFVGVIMGAVDKAAQPKQGDG